MGYKKLIMVFLMFFFLTNVLFSSNIYDEIYDITEKNVNNNFSKVEWVMKGLLMGSVGGPLGPLLIVPWWTNNSDVKINQIPLSIRYSGNSYEYELLYEEIMIEKRRKTAFIASIFTALPFGFLFIVLFLQILKLLYYAILKGEKVFRIINLILLTLFSLVMLFLIIYYSFNSNMISKQQYLNLLINLIPLLVINIISILTIFKKPIISIILLALGLMISALIPINLYIYFYIITLSTSFFIFFGKKRNNEILNDNIKDDV
jgi:hypothetical protein